MGGRKHLRKTWFLAVLVHMTWNLSMIRRLIKFCCLSCGTTKAANFTSTDCFFFFFNLFWFQMLFIYSHIQVGITLLMNLFPHSRRYWRGSTKATSSAWVRTLRAVSESLLWGYPWFSPTHSSLNILAVLSSSSSENYPLLSAVAQMRFWCFWV